MRTPEEAIELLRFGSGTELSLDHDLGLTDATEREQTGYNVLVWLEREIALGTFPGVPPALAIHSANSSARRRRELAVSSIERLHRARRG